MSVTIDKIFLTFGFILLFTLFIGIRAGPAIDVAYPDRFYQVSEDRISPDYIHYMAKRRFLPTKRDTHRYLPEDFSSENDDEDSHLNKRYFLKSKRYFLNSK